MKLEENLCGSEQASGLPDYVWEDERIQYPSCYMDRESLYMICELIEKKEKKGYCNLPFDQTIEAEILGGKVHIAKDGLGPRISKASYESVHQFLNRKIRTTYPVKVTETMEAVRMLQQDNYKVIYNLVGPMSILSEIIPMENLFITRRKNNAAYWHAIEEVQHVILKVASDVKGVGCRIFSLSDPVATPRLLGPDVMKELVTICYLPLLKELVAKDVVIHLCPRMVWALTEYGNATVERKDKGQILCGSCLKKEKRGVDDSLYQLVIA